jgi:hypothetical protein
MARCPASGWIIAGDVRSPKGMGDTAVEPGDTLKVLHAPRRRLMPAHAVDTTVDRLAERGSLTGEEIAVLAERTAHELLGCTLEEALEMLRAGELAGTPAESAMTSMHILLTGR